MLQYFRFFLVSLVFTLGTTSTAHADSCDPNYKQSGIKIFGLIYGGDSLHDVLCNLQKMNMPADVYHRQGENFSLSKQTDFGPLNGKMFYSPRTADVNFKNIQLFGISYYGTVNMRYSAGEDKILGLGAMRLNQGRELSSVVDNVFMVGYPFAITFNVLNEPKTDDDFRIMETQKRDLIKSLEESLLERGLNKNQIHTNFTEYNDDSGYSAYLEFDNERGFSGGVESNSSIWFQYYPNMSLDLEINSAMTFITRAKTKNINKKSNTDF